MTEGQASERLKHDQSVSNAISSEGIPLKVLEKGTNENALII